MIVGECGVVVVEGVFDGVGVDVGNVEVGIVVGGFGEVGEGE